jgi:hypothetical protein
MIWKEVSIDKKNHISIIFKWKYEKNQRIINLINLYKN